MVMEKLNIENQLKNKGIKNPLVLKSFQDIPQEFFLSKKEFPFHKKNLNIENRLDYLEPRIITVAHLLDQLDIKKGEKILALGIDSVYILVILSKIYNTVYNVETNEAYAEWSKQVLKNLNVDNVNLKVADEQLGWEEVAPFDVILVASEMENISDCLKNQLKIGGNLIAPIGPDWAHMITEKIQRVSETNFRTEKFRSNYFIPNPKLIPEIGTQPHTETKIVNEIKSNAKAFDTIHDFPIDEFLKRIGNAKVVLMGEASHGTSEFYMMRQEITKALIEKKGFNMVCAEADWSDAEQINEYVKNSHTPKNWMPFNRFPQWMWRNKEVLSFVEWLKEYNATSIKKTGFYGLDLYGLENSIDLVIKYLENIDFEMADLAKNRYGCISPYMSDPAIYGKLVLTKQMESCEEDILKMLVDLLKNKNKLNHSDEYYYTYQNAMVVVDAERYYKHMYYGSAESWNLRDFHMFHTLQSLLSYLGRDTKAIVWAHNSHIGNALATEMYSRGEINIGHLCKEYYGKKSYHIGFGTHSGTVAAAHNWGERMEIMKVRDSMNGSYENYCHQTQIKNFTLPLREEHSGDQLKEVLNTPKLERAIGVIYRPATERLSHYFHAVLPSQFDEYVYFDKTHAVTPVSTTNVYPKLSNVHPFSLMDD